MEYRCTKIVEVEIGHLFYSSFDAMYAPLELQIKNIGRISTKVQSILNRQVASVRFLTSATAKNPVGANLGTDQIARVFQGDVIPFNILRVI